MSFRTSCLVAFLVVGSGFAAPPPATIDGLEDPVAATMLRMRLAGALLHEQARATGRYPRSDGALIPLREALGTIPAVAARSVLTDDAWGGALLYRATSCCYRLVSLGADGVPEREYGTLGSYPPLLARIEEAAGPDADLVLVNGRFTARPFGEARPAIETVNSMTKIAQAMFSYAVDNNRYPPGSGTFAPVSGLTAELAPVYLPEVPLKDGWGRPLVYFSTGSTFGLASFGADGEPDRTYLTDLAAGIPWNDEGPSPGTGADVVFANGRFVHWPAGVEP